MIWAGDTGTWQTVDTCYSLPQLLPRVVQQELEKELECQVNRGEIIMPSFVGFSEEREGQM